MKAFEFKETTANCDYPDEMGKIINHLEKYGTVNVGVYTLERLYREFSDSHYAAGWMEVDDAILTEFAYWLSKQEV